MVQRNSKDRFKEKHLHQFLIMLFSILKGIKMNNKKKIIALIVVLATLVQVLAGGMVFAYNSVVSEKVEENNVQFKDISGHWAENSINYLANKGLVKVILPMMDML